MQDEQIFCRLAVYRNCINPETDEFDEEHFLRFNKMQVSNGSLTPRRVMSVVTKRIGENAVHKYGIEVAEIKTERKRKNRSDNGQIFEETDREIYLGYYELAYTSVKSITMKFHHIDVVHRPENDFDAHFQIEIWLKSVKNKPSRKEQLKDRDSARSAMFDFMKGPFLTEPNVYILNENLFSYLPKKNLF